MVLVEPPSLVAPNTRLAGTIGALVLGIAPALAIFPGPGFAVSASSQAGSPAEPASSLLAGARDEYVESGPVKIHCVSLGRSGAPLLVMIHGFPDFWYSWRAQMPTLAQDFHVVAIDQRGYNLSSQPTGVENYAMGRLVDDVAAVVRHYGRGSVKAVIVGHDWGGMVAWSFAMVHPDLTDRLIVLNLPHPRGLARELATNPIQQKNSQYARDFQKPEAASKLTADMLAGWVTDPAARKVYQKAMARSSMEGMLNYYKANYPKDAADAGRRAATAGAAPPINCPVLLIHGLKDEYLLPGALNDTWMWIKRDFTLVTIPDAGHFVQQDASDLVTRTMKSWLLR